MNPLLDNFRKKSQEIIELAKDNLKSIKTGRAKPSLVEDIKVEAYDSLMSIKELASITAPDPQQIVISPWDKTLLESIAKAINTADLNMNPIIDGNMIRINIPLLTQESRQELVKLVCQKLESMRAILRQERGEVKSKIEAGKNQPGVSEDQIRIDLDEMQKITDETMDKLDQLSKEKEAELMKVGG